MARRNRRARPAKGGFSYAEQPSLLARLPFERISLERRAGNVTAPNYRVVFHRSGRAELDDKGGPGFGRGGPTVGRFTADLDPYGYARLCYLIERSRFESLRSEYSIIGSDFETVLVTVTGATGEHTVLEYGLVGPIELWTIQQAIDALRAQTMWQPVK